MNDAFVRGFVFDEETTLKDYFDSTNEPSQQIPFMYHYVNRPALSARRSRETLKLFYNTTVEGLPGNDGRDCRLVAFPHKQTFSISRLRSYG